MNTHKLPPIPEKLLPAGSSRSVALSFFYEASQIVPAYIVPFVDVLPSRRGRAIDPLAVRQAWRRFLSVEEVDELPRATTRGDAFQWLVALLERNPRAVEALQAPSALVWTGSLMSGLTVDLAGSIPGHAHHIMAIADAQGAITPFAHERFWTWPQAMQAAFAVEFGPIPHAPDLPRDLGCARAQEVAFQIAQDPSYGPALAKYVRIRSDSPARELYKSGLRDPCWHVASKARQKGLGDPPWHQNTPEIVAWRNAWICDTWTEFVAEGPWTPPPLPKYLQDRAQEESTS